MAYNDLPAALQSVIQLGMLEREFRTPLRAKLGFRMIADREPFAAGIGETITKTRTGLLPANTTPMAPAQTADITSGLTPANYGVEQYTLGIAQYATPMLLNVGTSKVAIADLYLRNAFTLGENAARSVDTLAQQALFAAYMGGNTRVTATLGSAGTTINVDDVRGFFMTLTSQGVPIAVSAANPLLVVVGANSYTLTGVTADGTAPILNPWLNGLAFSGTGSNTTTTPGGYSGTLTFSTNVTVADGTANIVVQAATAPLVIRPSVTSTNVMALTTLAISSTTDYNNAKLSMSMVLAGKAQLSANAVPPVDESGFYHLYADPQQLTGLYSDPEFQSFFRGRDMTSEYRRGIVADLLGVRIIETNLNPIQNNAAVVTATGGAVHRGVLVGQGALVEGVFTNEAWEAASNMADRKSLITVVDGIAHITRPPLDVVQQVVTQTWGYAGGFVAPTDVGTTPMTVPTASNAAFKRGVMIESL